MAKVIKISSWKRKLLARQRAEKRIACQPCECRDGEAAFFCQWTSGWEASSWPVENLLVEGIKSFSPARVVHVGREWFKAASAPVASAGVVVLFKSRKLGSRSAGCRKSGWPWLERLESSG